MQLSKALGDPKKQDQYFSNVALKLNTKLGGLNHLLNQQSTAWLTKKKTMMVGIDVSHPGPSSREGTPSVAAVVASVDDSFVQFPASMRVQGSKKEVVFRSICSWYRSHHVLWMDRCSTSSWICSWNVCLFTRRRTRSSRREYSSIVTECLKCVVLLAIRGWLAQTVIPGSI